MRWVTAWVVFLSILAFGQPADAAQWTVGCSLMGGERPHQVEGALDEPCVPSFESAVLMSEEKETPRIGAYTDHRGLLIDGMAEANPFIVPTVMGKPMTLLVDEIVTGIDLTRTFQFDEILSVTPEEAPEVLEEGDTTLILY